MAEIMAHSGTGYKAVSAMLGDEIDVEIMWGPERVSDRQASHTVSIMISDEVMESHGEHSLSVEGAQTLYAALGAALAEIAHDQK